MFSGIHEILLVAAIILAVIFLPRINKSAGSRPAHVRSRPAAGMFLTGRHRLAILASFIWLAFWAVYYEPWGEEWKRFLHRRRPGAGCLGPLVDSEGPAQRLIVQLRF